MITRILICGTLVLASAANAQTEVPNTFEAGTPAHAAEVNENFDTLETAIDENANSNTQLRIDLDNEVSILQGEQAVQNDRLDALESVATIEECKAGRWIFGAELFDANGRTNVLLIGIQPGTAGESFVTEGGGLCLRGDTCTNATWTFLGTCL